MTKSWDAETFDRIHTRGPDPWDVDSSPYEREKYDRTLATIPMARPARVLEIGCSIGAQTAHLAERTGSLLALDISGEAIARAPQRCAHLAHVTIRQARIPQDWPPGLFDLIVISEMLYFLDRADVASTARLAVGSLTRNGAILLVNWTGHTDSPTTGEEAAALFVATAKFLHHTASTQTDYRVDLLEACSNAT